MNQPQFAPHIFELAKKFGNKKALCYRQKAGDEWNHITWKEFGEQINYTSNALLAFGLQTQDRIAQFSQNKPENLIIDFALYAIRGIMIPIYATSTTDQVEYIVNDAQTRLIFVGDQRQFDIAREAMSKGNIIEKIIVFDHDVDLKNTENAIYFSDFLKSGQKETFNAEIAQRTQQATSDDLGCIMYTSGTTGKPKGVMLPHSCFDEAMRIHVLRLTSVTDQDTSIAFLPLSHIFERMWCYFCLNQGVTIYINQFPTEIQQTIKEVRPTLMCAVPRFWEKVYAGVNENLSKFSPFMQGIVTWAIATGRIYNLDYKRTGKKPGLILKLRYKIADKLIFSKLKHTLGIENANMLPTAGARLADEIAVFFLSLGLPIVYGYGLTESTATVCCFDYTNFKIGTVGSVMPDIEVRIGEENEIQLKGKTIFSGYYNNEEATRQAFTEDGWFRTGDAGYLDGQHIALTERIKDLFKTSNGKYIAPQAIETRLVLDKYIEQAAIIGDERNYVTAIIHPSIPELKHFAEAKNITYNTTEELLANREIYQLIEERVALQQKGMAGFEQIKKFVLISQSFAIETGELTNTLKIRRAVVRQKYKSQIEQMYAV